MKKNKFKFMKLLIIANIDIIIERKNDLITF